MEGHAKGTLIVIITTLLSSALGAPYLSVDSYPSIYGSSESLKCTDSTYSSGNGYNWFKDREVIFNNNGEVSTTGKYSESISGTTFELVINNIDVSDEGIYTCSHEFADSNKLHLEVESRGTVTAELLSDNRLEVTFKQIYPSTISAVITCDSNIIPGVFVNSINVGDKFTWKWQSDNTFSIEPSSCSASVTLRSTFIASITFTTASTTEKQTTSSSYVLVIIVVSIIVGLNIIGLGIVVYFLRKRRMSR